MNRKSLGILVMALLLCGLTAAVVAQTAPPPSGKQYVFPGKGQTPEQQKADEGECGSWATGQTGFDPLHPPVYQPPPPPPPPPQGAALRGAARGAAAGYVIGDIADDKGQEGAAVGAVAGAARGARKKSQATQAQAQAANADKQAFDQKVAGMKQEYNKARTACLEGKGYTVK